MSEPICISLTDAHVITRSALKYYLNTQKGISVSIDTSTGNDLIKKIKSSSHHPDICIIDYALPQMSGYDTLLKIKQISREIKVVFLSMYSSPIIIQKILQAGADGYITKDEQPNELLTAINDVYNGCTYYPCVLIDNTQKYIQQNNVADLSITQREFQFLTFCGTEMSYKEIAEKMYVSPRTVESYRNNLFRKLQIKTRVGLAMYAIKAGIAAY